MSKKTKNAAAPATIPTPITDAARADALKKLAAKPAGEPKPAKVKEPKAPKEPKPKKPKRVSALDAAAQVLAASDKPMGSGELITEMEAKKLWKSPGGKTPAATLYAAMVREINTKKSASRFKKVDRGMFVSNA